MNLPIFRNRTCSDMTSTNAFCYQKIALHFVTWLSSLEFTLAYIQLLITLCLSKYYFNNLPRLYQVWNFIDLFTSLLNSPFQAKFLSSELTFNGVVVVLTWTERVRHTLPSITGERNNHSLTGRCNVRAKRRVTVEHGNQSTTGSCIVRKWLRKKLQRWYTGFANYKP